MDSTLLAILSIFGGALLTACAGFLGAWIQGRREHRRWIRERRFDAYVDIISLHNEIQGAEIGRRVFNQAEGKNGKEHLLYVHVALATRFPSALSAVALLGPRSVTEASKAVMAVKDSGDWAVRESAMTQMIAAMRVELNISG